MKALWLLLAAPALQEPARTAPDREGTLDNDVFVDASRPAAEALKRGDGELAQARAPAARNTPEESVRRLELALDAWHEALLVGGPGALVWLDAEAQDRGRVAEGTGAAVRRRLLALAPEERARWSERYAGAADNALALSRGSDEWSEIVRLHPRTRGAARAALWLADEALEGGALERARTWLDQAGRDAHDAGDDGLDAALAARRARVGEPPPRAEEAWESAAGATVVDSLRWKEPLLSARNATPAGLPRGTRAGLAFRSDAELWLQAPAQLLRIARNAAGELDVIERWSPGDLFEGFLGDGASEDEPRDAPRWPLLPLADEQGCLFVLGRNLGGEPNALAALEPSAEALAGLGLAHVTGAPSARLSWACVGDERFDPSGHATEIPHLAELDELEFQPGPVMVADTVVVQAREYAGQVRAWLLGIDRRNGELLWRTALASGAERVPVGRLASPRRESAQPLLVVDVDGAPAVFAGTNLGAGALVDVLSGEPLWVFKNRRRDPRSPGWSGDRPIHDARSPATILWAPADSDRLYFLRAEACRGGGEDGGLMTRAPAARDDALALLGGDAQDQSILDSSLEHDRVAVRRAGGDRFDALDLAPDERFRGPGLFSARRVWACTNRGVYLFDRERELYLLDCEPLRVEGQQPAGGDLYAKGDAVLVLGEGMLWSLRTR